MATKKKNFHIYSTIVVQCSSIIKAESLNDALEQSKGLKVSDFVSIHEEILETDMKITGVYEEHKDIIL